MTRRTGRRALHGKRPLSRWLAISLLWGLLCHGRTATAADPEGEKAAKAAFAEGNSLYEAGDYVGALDKFREAYRRFESPKILLNLGTTLRQLGQFAEAASTYESYLAHPKADPARKAEVTASLQEIMAKVGTLQIEVEPPGGKIRVDAKEVGQVDSMVNVRVDPGNHIVMADNGKGSPVILNVRVSAGESQKVRIRINEQPPSGTKAEDGGSNPREAGPGGGRKTLGYVLGSVGVVGLGVGAATYFVLDDKKRTMDAAGCDATTKICSGANLNDGANAAAGTKAASAGKSLQPLLYGGLAVGVVGLAAGAYFLFSPDTSTPIAVSVGPTGALIRGSF